jgi:hypothetical protein
MLRFERKPEPETNPEDEYARFLAWADWILVVVVVAAVVGVALWGTR